MTVVIEVSPDVEQRLRRRAAREGKAFEAVAAHAVALGADALEALELQPVAPDVAPDVAARLAALDALDELVRSMPNNRAGLPELDLSGPRADVYGYTEREDAQR